MCGGGRGVTHGGLDKGEDVVAPEVAHRPSPQQLHAQLNDVHHAEHVVQGVCGGGGGNIKQVEK